MPFEYEGDPEVLVNFFRKQELLDAGDPRHERYRTGIAGHGGGLAGATGAGQCVALAQHGLARAADVKLAVSTLTPAFSFSESGQIESDRSIYWMECLMDEFLSWGRLAMRTLGVPSFPMDIDWLCEVFRGHNTRGIQLDVEAMRRSRTAFFAAATASDGTPVLFDMRTAEDPFEAIKASIAMPGISRSHVKIGDDVYFDGDGAVPFPATELMNRFSPTDILILTNRPKPEDGILDRPVPARFLRTLPPGAREAFATKHLRFAHELKALRAQKSCRYGILWTDGSVDTFTMDAKRLEASSRNAEAHLSGLLAECRALACAA